ncbi:SusC/RagA family TonB-linked outer membrane protein [Namhaeicola litoreus]|uniref:SusC/RagA family TonB-linked outer membrane protein n=1 Tax=Namhaeicola litoreus TaxID=1052145 RepID=A0ABW3Y047_9FLAO
MKFNLTIKWKAKCFIITWLLCLSIGMTHAQDSKVRGIVTGDGSPLVGANVIVKGTNNGVVTDFDGNFEIDVQVGQTLEFSYVGFLDKQINITGSTTLTVSLDPDVNALDEVIVIGYGTQSKKEVTGAVANVGSETILKTATADLGTALQGQVAGVNVQASSGRPGEQANVQIRGLGSINTNALGPLYVVDGVPYQGNPNIAPEQIESVDILKDGAAASIYGTRASNGVILITTKTGKAGRMQIDFDAYTGIQNITSGTPLNNTPEQMYVENVSLAALGRESTIFFFSPNALDYDTDFVKDVQNDNAIIQNYNVGISGGVDNLTLNFSTNYFNQDGVLINSGFDRLTSRITGEFRKDKFKAFATMSFTEENREQEPFALYEQAVRQTPWQPAIGDLDNVGDSGFVIPVQNDIQYGYLSSILVNTDDRKTNSMNVALNLEYEIIDGLKYKLSGGRNTWDYKRKFYQPQYLIYRQDGSLSATASRENALLNEDYIWTVRNTVENILTYDKSFGKHNFNLLGVLSWEQFDYKSVGVGVEMSEETSNDLQTLGSGSKPNSPTSYDYTQTITGKLARLQYNFAERYLFSASYRRDGSSNFSEDNRYGDFWGFSAGWNIHEENFWKNANIKSINAIKLRASWAQLGNQSAEPYSVTPVIETGINYPFGPNEALNFGNIQRGYVDPDLKWETTISKNIGIDITMFDYKLNFTADVYQNDKEDMLLLERLPSSSGTYQPRADGLWDVRQTNGGNMVNKGIEIGLNFRDETAGGLKYTLNGTFTKNENEVTNLNGIQRGYANGRPSFALGPNIDYTTFLAEGYEAGAFFLVQTNGVIKTQEQLDAYKPLFGGAQFGDLMYKDINGDNKIDDADRVYAGSGQADFEAGFSLNLQYRNFDFYGQLYYSYGAEIFNGARYFAYTQGRHKEQYYQWSPQNANSDIPTSRIDGYHNNVRSFSDYWLEDGTYLRVRNLSLGYTIPNTINWGVEKARFYLSATNPFTFTKYTGYDPEIGGDGIFTRGLDRGNYPIARQFLFGVQLSF